MPRGVGDQGLPGHAGAWTIDGPAAGLGARIFSTHGSPRSTAPMSMTSARPRMRGRVNSSVTSAGPSTAPASSQRVAGTHDDAMKNRSSGSPSLALRRRSMPGMPRTLPTSWGSATIAVVPCGTTTFASSAGMSSVLST